MHSHIDVLASLHFNGNALSPTELYDAMLFSSGGMTKVLKKLEEKGILKAEEFKNEIQREIEQNYGFYLDKYYAER